MAVITLINENKTIEVPIGANLRQALRFNKISPYKGISKILNCRGEGLCGTCRVEVIDGKGVSSRKEDEENILISSLPFYARKIEKNIRLTCQTNVTGDVSVKTFPIVEIDKIETKRLLIKSGIVALFTFIFGGTFLVMFLDMIKWI
ncbi:MAG: 2Fe-2S iron-sulfur cluster-binding protein [Bacteroidetes bacterium]|nr:2Fe-2S iron-sulfur cluster-binding protein [Bacteroidota bacterium]